MVRIISVVEDLFFLVKIQAAAKQIGAELTIVSTAEALRAKAAVRPDIFLFDLNGVATKPLESVAWIREQTQLSGVKVIGYISHVQTELRSKALEAGFDAVYARSVFSTKAAEILAGD